LNRVFEVLLGPLAPLPILGSLAVLSLITAIAALLVMHVTSDHQAHAAVRRQMYADMLEIRLFKDDLWLTGRALWSLCRHNVAYLRLALVPALWTVVPLAVVIAQLHCYYGYSGVGVREPVLVTAILKSGTPQHTEITLDVPPGMRLETPSIWFPGLQQVVWRLVADGTGDYILGVQVSGTIYEKTLHVSNGLARRSPLRSSGRLVEKVLNPSEPPLPDSAPLASIGVNYPAREIDVFGAPLGWMNAFTMLSIVFALALKRPVTRVLNRTGFVIGRN
jgi:hypothetical protein